MKPARLDDAPVAIVGAGWAGLACALTLMDAGLPAHVYESAPQAGGRARRVQWRGLALDNGQHLMIGAYHHTLALLRRLHPAPALEQRSLELHLPGFRLRLPRLPAPAHLGVGLLRARGVSWREKLAAARFVQSLQARDFRISPDINVAALLAGQPARVVDQIWAPICIAALNTPLALASAQVFCNVLRDSLMRQRADSDFIFNRADLGRLLPDAALAALRAQGGEVHLGRRVLGVRAATDSPAALTLDFGPEWPARAYRDVVIATHPAQVARLTEGLSALADTRAQLARFTWQPIVTCWLLFTEPPRLPYPMLGLGPGQAPWAFERDDIAPGLVALVESADGPHLRQTAQALTESYRARLEHTLGALPPLIDSLCIVEKRATFTCEPQLPRPPNRTPQPGLWLAGDYTAGPYPATLEGAVMSGLQCARQRLENR